MATTPELIFQYIDYTLVFLKWSWPFVILIWMFVMKKVWSRFPIEAIIIEKRGENLIKTNERVGRYVDPAGIIGYKLHKCGDTIPIANYDWVMHNVHIPGNLLERLVSILRGNIGTIFLFKYGSKQYKPIMVKIKEGTKKVFKEVLDANGEPIWINIYQPIDPRDKLGALDFEVIDWDNMNFMVQEQRATILRRQKSSEFWKSVLIPLGIIGLVAIVCIIAMKFSFDWATEMRGMGNTQANQAQEDNTAQPTNIPIIGDMINP